MHRFLTIPLFLSTLLGVPMSAQTSLARELADRYTRFHITEIASRRFSQRDLSTWITPLVDGSRLRSQELGRSAEGKAITQYTFGHGPAKVLLWSQMHGDEPTATMALADMLKFFATEPAHPLVKLIEQKLTLLMIPMLNPDGADRFTRRTAQLVDVNRDALALQSPEARILKEVQQREQPAYGFNLHDQDIHYTVGTTKKPTAIALLAPPVDEARSDNDVRVRAKRLATVILNAVEEFAPGYIAKWDDTFEPRAFGDNIQRWGTSTVLIESGVWVGDTEKMELRKLNAIGMLCAFAAIADGSLERVDTTPYERLPFNMKLTFDLILRNATFQPTPAIAPVRVDLGINFEEEEDSNGAPHRVAVIMDIGDLSVYHGFKIEDVNGRRLNPSRIRIESPFPADEINSLFGN